MLLSSSHFVRNHFRKSIFYANENDFSENGFSSFYRLSVTLHNNFVSYSILIFFHIYITILDFQNIKYFFVVQTISRLQLSVVLLFSISSYVQFAQEGAGIEQESMLTYNPTNNNLKKSINFIMAQSGSSEEDGGPCEPFYQFKTIV